MLVEFLLYFGKPHKTRQTASIHASLDMISHSVLFEYIRRTYTRPENLALSLGDPEGEGINEELQSTWVNNAREQFMGGDAYL